MPLVTLPSIVVIMAVEYLYTSCYLPFPCSAPIASACIFITDPMLFKTFFTVLSPLLFHMNFRISILSSMKNFMRMLLWMSEIFIGIALSLYIVWGELKPLQYCLLIQECGMFQHLFTSSVMS